MALIIPVNSEPDRELQIQLGDNLLTVRTYFNETALQWFMDLYDENGEPLALGLAMVPIINLLESETELTRNIGQFRVQTTNDTENRAPDSLGNLATLWWYAPGEFESLGIEDIEVNPLPFNVRSMYSVYTPPQPEYNFYRITSGGQNRITTTDQLRVIQG